MRAPLNLESLETRECPAFVKSFANGTLRITFDNEVSTGQAVTISAANGHVTLNERATKIPASAVTKIVAVGSDLDNWIDLRYVSTGTGFRGLNGKVTLNGGGGNDVLTGSQFGDKVAGGGGFDQLFGGNGNDVLDGGAGDDWIYHGYGADTIIVGNGNDWIDRLEPLDVTRTA